MPVNTQWTGAGATASVNTATTDSPAWAATGAASAIDSAFAPVTLSQAGDTMTLSANVSFTGLSATATAPSVRFAWDLFNANGQTGATGWTGYLATNDTASGGVQSLWKKPAGNTSAFYATDGGSALATYALAPTDFSAGDYRLTLKLGRTSTGAPDYQGGAGLSGGAGAQLGRCAGVQLHRFRR